MSGAHANDLPTGASCGIAVMAKASIPGKTKTRLVPPLTFEEAAAFNTAFLEDVAANIAAAAAVEPITGYMAYGPPGSAAFFESTFLHPRGVVAGLIGAWHADFGECLFTAIEQVLERGHACAVVLNSDSPTLPTTLLVETARVLARPGDRAVLGQSRDGGYYLLGVKARHRRLFEDVTWSTDKVARQTLDRAAEIGLDVHMLPDWYDVDDLASLRMLRGELIEAVPFAPSLTAHTAARSAELLGMLLARTDLDARLDAAAGPLAMRAAE